MRRIFYLPYDVSSGDSEQCCNCIGCGWVAMEDKDKFQKNTYYNGSVLVGRGWGEREGEKERGGREREREREGGGEGGGEGGREDWKGGIIIRGGMNTTSL